MCLWVSAGGYQRWGIGSIHPQPHPRPCWSQNCYCSFGLSIVGTESWNSSSSASVRAAHALACLLAFLLPFYVHWYFASMHVCVKVSDLGENSQCPQPLSSLSRPQFMLFNCCVVMQPWFGLVEFGFQTGFLWNLLSRPGYPWTQWPAPTS